MLKNSLLFLLLSAQVSAQSLEDLFLQAKAKNEAVQNTQYQKELATLTRKVADLNRYNPRIPLSYQALDNIALQKVLVPGVIFGLPEGTYKEMIMGQKYSSTLSVAPQFDILNFGLSAQKKSAVQNEKLVLGQSLQKERDIYLQLNSAYHNVLSYQGQLQLLRENLQTADKILQIISDRLEEGLVRPQEKNEAEINVLNIRDNIEQLEIQWNLQREMLRLLSRSTDTIEVTDSEYQGSAQLSELDKRVAEAKAELAAADKEVAKRDQWPVLSAISSFNWQNLSNSFFYASGNSPIYYAYLGLKLSWDLPSTPQKISNYKSKEIQYKIAQNEIKSAEEQGFYDHMQRQADLQKAKNRVQNLRKIEELKKDTFDKNYARFEENVLTLDELLQSQNDWINSRINRLKEEVNAKYASYTIKIYNEY